MVCATWLTIITLVEKNPSRTFYGNKSELEEGFKIFLSDNANDLVDHVVKDTMSKKLLDMIMKFFNK